jgi:hypothetical protein
MMKQFETPDLRSEIQDDTDRAMAALALLRQKVGTPEFNQVQFINAEQDYLKAKDRLDHFNKMMNHGGANAKE